MAKLVTGGKVVLVWDDGQTVELGTVGIDYGKVGIDNGEITATMTVTKAKRIRQRIGWEMVRNGFRCMMPGRKWRMKVGEPDAAMQDMREDHTDAEV